MHEPAGESYGLRLNSGKKWTMDDHTRSMFVVMVDRIEAQQSDDEPSSSLGSALRKDIDELIAGCTMTGRAHDELHKLLIAFIPAVEELASQGSDEALTAVQKILDSYPRYFE